MRKILLPLMAVVFSFAASSQNAVRCGSMDLIRQQMAIDPVYAKKVQDAAKNIKGSLTSNKKGKPTTINIAVAVHVLYNTAEQNISDAQVQSQIDVMNEDFTATNSDYNNYDAGYGAVKGDFEIKFCLSQVIHKKTRHKSFAVNDNMKYSKKGGDDAIDPMHVFNIWVCDIGQNVLGFAYYPGISPEKFGVVCHYKAFGRGSQYNLFSAYNLGRTVTHETGHCFGLIHIWGDATCGNDQVDDTPLHNAANFGCPGEGHLSTCTGTPLEMWMNYMDYTDDRCMYFFSDGQAARADYFMTTDPQLNSIINSTCSITNRSNNDITTTISDQNTLGRKYLTNYFSLYPTITPGKLTLSIDNASGGNAEVNIYSQNGVLMMKKKITLLKGSAVNDIDVSRLANGIYFLELSSVTDKQTRKFIVQH